MAKKPINVLISESADDWLRYLAVEQGLSLGVIVERAILAVPDPAKKVPDWAGEMTFDLTALADRVKSLESLEPRLNAIEAWLDGVRAEVEAAGPDPVAVAVEPAAVPDPPVSRKKARAVRSRDGMLP